MRLPIDAEKALSAVRLRVRFYETDLMGIVHHSKYLWYFEAARVEWLRRRGVTYADWAARGIHLPVVDVQLKYLMPARFDDELTIETSLGEQRLASVRFDYRILRGQDLLTTGATRLACVNQDHAVRRIPEEVHEVLRSAETQPPSLI